MRTIPSAELTAWTDGDTSVRQLRVRIKRPEEASYTDLSSTLGGDWALGVRADGDTPDQPAGRFTLRFLKHATEGSLSPGLSAAAINKDASLAYRPLMHPGRDVEVDVRIDANPWRLWLKGQVEDVDWGGTDITLTCLTLDGVILATQIETEETRGAPDPGTPVQTEIQGLLTRWMTTAPALLTVGSPAWGVGVYKPAVGSLGEQNLTHAQRNGWDVRYKWSEADSAFRYTLYLPNRDKTVADFALGLSLMYEVAGLRISRQYVRNRIVIRYRNAAGDEQTPVVVEDTGSITEYGKRAMVIAELSDDSPIKTSASATALGTYAKKDLATPLADGRWRIPFLPWLELHDLITLQADADHYDFDTNFAVVGLSHVVEPEGGWWTEVELRGGKPAGAFFSWHDRTPTAAPDPALLTILTLEEVARTDTYVDVLPVLGGEVDRVWVYDTLWTLPITGSTVPSSVDDVTTILLPGESYRALVPPQGKERIVYFYPYSSAGTAGEGKDFKVGPAFVNDPWFEFVEPTPTSPANPAARNLSVRVRDPQGLGGTFELWTTNARTAAANATLTLTATPATLGPTEMAALGNVPVHPVNGATVFLRFTNVNGATTGQQSRYIQGASTAVTFDDLLRPAIVDALALANEAVEAAKIKLRAVGTTQLALSGVQRDNIIDGAINEAKTNIATLAGITTNAGNILQGRFDNLGASTYLNLNATGTAAVFAHPKFAIYANGDATFSGVLAAGTILTGYLVVAGNLANGAVDRAAVVVDGTITAAKLNVGTLSAVTPNAGIIVSGELRNAAGTRYINLSATGVQPFIAHEKFEVRADGTAIFKGELIAAIGTFTGTLTAATGTFTGTLTAGATSASPLSALNANLGTVTAGRIQNAANSNFWNLDANGLAATIAAQFGALNIRGDGSVYIGSQVTITAAGAATFSGALSAASGTFAGSLSAATGTFAGSLSAATGTFSGTVSASAVVASTSFTAAIAEFANAVAIGKASSPVFLIDAGTNVVAFNNVFAAGPFQLTLNTSDFSVNAEYGRFVNLVVNFKTVSVGAADSGGAGFRVLRVPN